MADIWLDWAVKVPVYGKGNGPFGSSLPLGWVLHVNQSNGNLDAFFAGDSSVNPSAVCPNFQVYKDGTVHQHLPLLFSPWCQVDGNATYCAVETEGYDSEPLTPQQVTALARLHNAYHDAAGVPDQLASTPGQRGIGIHSMGGASWGGHSCPGSIRAGQRVQIVQAAQTIRPTTPAPTPTPAPREDEHMYLLTDVGSPARTTVLVLDGVPVLQHDGATVDALVAAGVRRVGLPSDQFAAVTGRLGPIVQ